MPLYLIQMFGSLKFEMFSFFKYMNNNQRESFSSFSDPAFLSFNWVSECEDFDTDINFGHRHGDSIWFGDLTTRLRKMFLPSDESGTLEIWICEFGAFYRVRRQRKNEDIREWVTWQKFEANLRLFNCDISGSGF